MHQDFYLSLITSEHRDQPQFSAVVQLLTNAVATNADLGLSLIDAFDLDQATGAQLDAIGLWVGMFRGVPVPISGIYFAWDGTVATGWEQGYWQGPFDPSFGIVNVDDVTYRTLLRAKIAANLWDGTLESMYEFWDYVLGPGVIVIQDNQDMSMTLVYDSLSMSSVMQSLLTAGAFPLKPSGVKINYTLFAGSPIFSWDLMTTKFQGWTGASVWTAP